MSRVDGPGPLTGPLGPWAIEAEGLVKEFKGFRAVDGLSFTIPRGQVCALLGPNGAGKTTTIHMLLGLMIPTEGRVRVLGHDVGSSRREALARTNFMASYVSLPYRLSVREVLIVNAHLYEVPDVPTAVDATIELLGIGALAKQRYSALSSGQQTMVALGKALVNDPELLFLDEPTSSLDPENAFDVRRVLERVNAERGTTVFITGHNMVEIERLAHRVLFLSAGRLVADASVNELREQFGIDDLEDIFLHVARGARTQGPSGPLSGTAQGPSGPLSGTAQGPSGPLSGTAQGPSGPLGGMTQS